MWESETFRKRFLASYGVKAEIEPSITSDEKELFEVLIPLVQEDQVDQAITLLNEYMASAEEVSAALDFTLGNLHFQENHLDEAANAYATAIRKFPTFSRAYENMGRIAVMKGNFEESRSYLIQALELGGPQSGIYGLLGFSYLNLEKPSSSLVAYDAASLLDPSNKDWQLGRAQALVQSQRNEEAIPLLKELVNEDLSNRNLILSISNAYLDMGEYLKSAAYLELLNRSGLANSSSLLLLGDIYMNEGLYGLALPVYKQAMDTEGDRLSRSSAMRVAKVYVERQLVPEAKSVIALIEGNYPDPDSSAVLELLNLKSRIALYEGDAPEARNLLEQIIKEDPMNGDALMTLATLFQDEGDIESAEFYYVRGQAVSSVRFRAFLQHGRMLVGAQRYAEAANLLSRAYDLNPSDNLEKYLEAVKSVASR